jgi:hypothetical protein
VATLLAFAGGALLLMADSASCPDGYATASFDATYTSTCGLDYGAAQGTVHLPVTGEKGAELTKALKESGLLVDAASINTTEGGSVCVSLAFSVSFAATSARPALTCASVQLDLDVNRIDCTSGALDPAALRLGKRDLGDGAAGDAQADAEAEAASPPGTTDSGLGPVPAAPLQPPSERRCVLTFTRLARP